MKKRIVSLMTAVLVAATVFAVPVLAETTNETTETTAGVIETTQESEESGSMDTTETVDPSEPTDSTEPIDPSEPTSPVVPSVPEDDADEPTQAEPINIAAATIKISQSSYTFTKKAVKPAVTVKLNGETLVKGTDYTVKYSNNIYPGTAKITITGINDYTGKKTKTFGIATVKSLKWEKSTTSSIKIDWAARSNVTGYNVYKYNWTKEKWQYVKTVKKSEATITGLQAGSGNAFRVRAIYKKGTKTYYSPVSATIKIPTKPAKCSITKVINHPSLYAKASWGQKKSSGYQVRISRNASFKNASTYKVASSSQTNKKISNLKDNQVYYIKVRAYRTYSGKTTYGAWSKTQSISTDGTRWYNVNGYKYYYKNGKKIKGKLKIAGEQYYFNEETGAWSGVSSKMWNKVKNSTSKTKYLIAVSRELNRICVYTGSKGNWKIKYHWKCSTGAPTAKSISKTPAGSWLMPKFENHLGYIGGHKDYTCWYATRFYNRCFFHSVLYEPASKSHIQDGRLGMNISDGCIRMDIDNAKWIYDNCHTGTRVIVY